MTNCTDYRGATVKPFVRLVASLVGFFTGLVVGRVFAQAAAGGDPDPLFSTLMSVSAAIVGAIGGSAFGDDLVKD